jgi:RHS repeat-associated protein
VYDLPAVPAPGTQSQALQAGGWNCSFERRVDAAQTVTDAAYVWGLDLSGSMQGAHSTGSGPSAGGIRLRTSVDSGATARHVGGLLQASAPTSVGGALPPSRIRPNQVYCYYSERYGATGRAAIFYVYDGSRPRPGGGDGLSKGAQRATEGSSESEGRPATSGNVTALVDAADGSVVARYDYSPFGMTVLADGSAADANPWRFSTKYHDSETALVYYGYRYYSPELGRWINRDPIQEKGGVALYVVGRNGLVNTCDPTGLMSWDEIRSRTMSVIGGFAQLTAGISFITAGAGSIFGTGGLSIPVAIGAITLGGALYFQGVSNLIDGLSPGRYNPLRSSFSLAATSMRFSSSTGERFYYGTEVFTAVASIGIGSVECARIVISGTKTVTGSYTFLRPFQLIGEGRFAHVLEVFRYTQTIQVKLVTRFGTVLTLANDFYQYNESVNGWIEEGNEVNGLLPYPEEDEE